MASPEVSPHPLHLLLPKIGTEEEFATLRETLRQCGFDGPGICKHLGIASIHDFKAKCDGRQNALEIEQPIDVLIRLVLDGEFVSQEVVSSKLGAKTAAAMESLGIVARDPDRPGDLFSTITMYPAMDWLMLAGDRPGTPDGSKYWLPPDVVYPGILENTQAFLAALPDTPCDAFLDLGTGSGVAALAASRYARHAWGADIASRSVRFAEFSRRLNHVQNVSMVEGDLYEPVAGLTFDRIVTHPPYVPSPKTEMIFRDGGDDGEQILRRAIEGLPKYLRLEGRFYTLVLGADVEGENFEDRIRKWLGPMEGEFDLVLVSHALRSPAEFVANSLKAGKVRVKDLKFWSECWTRRKAQFLFYGSVLVRRHAGNRPAVTVRVQKGEGFQPRHQDWLLEWESACKAANGVEMLLDCRPSIAPTAALHVLHRVQDGRFSPELFGVQVKEPFSSDIRCARWMVAVINECNGVRSWREHLAWAKNEGVVSTDSTEEEFAAILVPLVTQGVLRVREHQLL